jgi:hypothetical protein
MTDILTSGEKLSSRQLEDLMNSYRGLGETPFRMPQQATFSLGTYTPPGPVCGAYIRSEGPIDAIMGPGGSGKTIGSAFKAVRFVVKLMPICLDGVIRGKVTVVRDNYRQLYKSTLQSWFHWFPTTRHPDFSGGQDRPGTHRLKLMTYREIRGVMREVKVDLQVEFFAIADIDYEFAFKSYETSYAWPTEADSLPPASIPFFFSRTGRYPSLDLLPDEVRALDEPLPRALGWDMNPPPPKHPTLVAAQRGSFREDFDPAKDRRTINFFVQPSGLAENAENRAGKTRRAYELELEVMPKDDARRMVLGLPGRVKDGLPVYDEDFDREKHVAPSAIEILPNVPLHLGFDQGGQSGGAGQPAVVGFQVAPNGQYRGVLSIATKPGTGAERFLDQLVPVLRGRFRNVPPGVWTGDPAGFMGGDKVYGTLSWFEIVQRTLGHRIDPAHTQQWTERLEALGTLMRRDISRDTPRLLLCPIHCGPLIEALAGDFKFGKRHDGTYDPLPVKNMAANVAEAAQYVCLGLQGLAGVAGMITNSFNPSNVHSLTPRAVVQTGDWPVF